MLKTAAFFAGALFAAAVPVWACDTHLMMGLPEPLGIWPEFSDTMRTLRTSTAAPTMLSAPSAASIVTNSVSGFATNAAPASIVDPAVTAWMLNTTGKKGTSPNSTVNATVSLIDADVQTVAYNSTNVYIKATGVPSHAVGPFSGNPNIPSNQNRTVRLPRTPVQNTGTKTTVGLGNIGVMVNGVAFFNNQDAMSYNNQNVWHQNANVFEAVSFDTAPGHPQQQGNYHYHQKPTTLINQLDACNTGQHHSPIIGFAFDGFPIYGPYGYANANGTGGIVRERSGYSKRNITVRQTLPDGTVLSAAQYGPSTSTTALGSYAEDYVYDGSGDLDQYNGRFVVTPEYPGGTYAYFSTIDSTGAAAYPYLIGPQYYGVVDTANTTQGTITVPGDVTFYSAPEPSVLSFVGVAGIALMRRNRAMGRR